MNNKIQLTCRRFRRKSYHAYLNEFARFALPCDAISYEEYDQLAKADLKQCEPLVMNDVDVVTQFYSEEDARDLAFQHATKSTDPLPGEAIQVSADCPLLDAIVAVKLALWDKQEEVEEHSTDLAVQHTILRQYDKAQASIETGDFSVVQASNLDDGHVATIHFDHAHEITVTIQRNEAVVSGIAKAPGKHETRYWRHMAQHPYVEAGLACDERRLKKYLLWTIQLLRQRAVHLLKSYEEYLSDHQAAVDNLNAVTAMWQSGIRDSDEFEPYLAEFADG